MGDNICVDLNKLSAIARYIQYKRGIAEVGHVVSEALDTLDIIEKERANGKRIAIIDEDNNIESILEPTWEKWK